MTESVCPSLRRLDMLLRTAYRLRDNSLVGGKDNSALAKAPNESPFCIFKEALRGVPLGDRNFHSNVIPIDQVH